jgi:tetratricopeptide (TPR) repeat protein
MTKDGYKVDWEATMGHNETPFKVFVATAKQGAIRLRVLCKVDTYFNFEYSDCQQTHYSVSLTTKEPYEFLHGYIAKDSASGERLFKLLKDGGEHQLILELKLLGPTGFPVDGTHRLGAITKIVSESWVDMSAEEEAEEKAKAKRETEEKQLEARKEREKTRKEAEEEAMRAAPRLLNEAKQLVEKGNAEEVKGKHKAASELFQRAANLCQRILKTVPGSKIEKDAQELLRQAEKLEESAKAEAEKLEQSAKNERDAARQLKLAKALAGEGLVDKAKRRYQEIIEKYPNTKAAEEAKRLLEK